MAQFPWTQTVVEDIEDKKPKKQETKKPDKETTNIRYIPWLFKDNK